MAERRTSSAPPTARTRVGGVVRPGQDDDPGCDEARHVVHVAVGLVQVDPQGQPDDLSRGRGAPPRYRSIPSCERSGFRFGLSRHSDVVSAVPSPSTSNDPPPSPVAAGSSRPPRARRASGRGGRRRPRGRTARRAAPPQALNRQSTARRPPAPSTTNVGPVSRTQPSFVVASTTRDVRRQPSARVAPLRARGDDGHRLAPGDRLGQPHPRGLRRLGAVAPGVRALGPDQVATVVPLPFGGHAEAVLARRARKNAGHGCFLEKGSDVGQAR